MDLFIITFRIFILTPIRIVIDLIKWFFNAFIPFIRENFRYMVLFFLFYVIMFLFPDIIISYMTFIWDKNRNFLFNIYRIPINIIIYLFFYLYNIIDLPKLMNLKDENFHNEMLMKWGTYIINYEFYICFFVYFLIFCNIIIFNKFF